MRAASGVIGSVPVQILPAATAAPIPAPSAAPSPAASGGTRSGALAATGSATGELLAVALLALVAGAAGLVVRRRRA